MNFELPPQTTERLQKIRDIVDSHVIPLEESAMAAGGIDTSAAVDACRDKVKSAGLWAPQLPTDVGGMGLPLLDFGLVSLELGRSPLGHYCFGCQAPDAGNMEILHKYGTDAQKSEFLEPLAAGQIRSCFSMTEPEHAGSNPTEMSCSARRDRDDYVIDGHKWFTTAADGAAFAVVMAVTNPDAAPHRRASQIIVPTDADGFELVRNIPIMGHAGHGWGSHAEVRYHGVRVPIANRIGDEGAGFVIAQERLGPGRIHHCMRWLGICERAIELMCRRASSRIVRSGQRLADQQIVRAWIAESRAEADASRWMVLAAAEKIDREGFAAARQEISLIKFHVAGVMQRIVDRAVQVHGALGITNDTVLGFFYSHERGARIYDGPDEVHKMVVAKQILRGYEADR